MAPLPENIDPWSRAGWTMHGISASESVSSVRARLSRGSIPAILATNEKRHPNKLAVSVDGEALTYSALVHRVSRGAGWLQARGIRRGDRVIVSGRNSADLLVACLAVKWAEGICVVANPTYTGPELEHYMTDCGASGVLADGEVLEKLHGRDGWQHLTAVVRLDRGYDGKRLPTLDNAILASRSLPLPRLSNSALCALHYTSGTTGRPKGVQLSHANLLAYFRAIIVTWRWRPTDVLVHSLPLTHGHGLNGVFTALMAGAVSRRPSEDRSGTALPGHRGRARDGLLLGPGDLGAPAELRALLG